jgi:VWFA-related protein
MGPVRFLLLAVAALAQEPPRIRITVNLVQVDAVVTDAAGRHVADLTAGDFEIFQDGKRQRITAFSYVPGTSIVTRGGPAFAAGPKTSLRKAATAPAGKPARRVIVMVVDDLGLTTNSIYRIRAALREFVENHMQPDDLVAIVRVSGGVGVLQQLTSDKQRLLAAVERVRSTRLGRVEIDPVPPLQVGYPPIPRAGLGADRGQAMIEILRSKMYTLSSLGALNVVIRGLRDLPGRKSVMLFSEDLRLDARILEAARNVTDMANRSAAVVDVIDPRGVVHTGLRAADDLSAKGLATSPRRVNAIDEKRMNAYIHSMEGLAWLAEQTGGLFIHGDNDLSGGIQRVLADKEGYYLIGYTPGPEAFTKTREGSVPFHTLGLRLKRRGLQLRYRHGFFGVPDEQSPARRPPLVAALLSPFGAEDVRVKLTPVFGQDPEQGPYLTSLLHIDGRDLRFTEESGSRKVALETMVATLDENGHVTAQTTKALDVPVDPAKWEQFQTEGLVYAVAHYVKKPGQYQLRAAVEDRATGRVGSAASFVKVPDAADHRLTLSGILLGTVEALATADIRETSGTPAVRVFKAGSALRCELDILNARPPVETRMKIYREGREFYSGAPTTLPTDNTGRIHTLTRYTLPPGMAPGEYTLELLVTDASATAGGAIDFEVVR